MSVGKKLGPTERWRVELHCGFTLASYCALAENPAYSKWLGNYKGKAPIHLIVRDS